MLGYPNLGKTDARTHLVLRQYDASGVALWTRQFAQEVFDHAVSLAVDPTDTIYTLVTRLRSYDGDGNEKWTTGLYRVQPRGRALFADRKGNIYVAGTTNPPGTFLRLYSQDGKEVWTRQLVQWQKQKVATACCVVLIRKAISMSLERLLAIRQLSLAPILSVLARS